MAIKQIRESKNMTQEELAKDLQVSRSTVAMWETGQSMPRADVLVRMCTLFKCSADELLGLAQPQPAKNTL